MTESGGPDAGALQEALVHLFDPNVRVPQTPRLVDDLDVFDMPDGLGIQFRGGAFPVVIRGRSAAGAWSYLRTAMNGNTSLADLVAHAPRGVGRTAVAKLLSLLHGKGLLMQEMPVLMPAGPRDESRAGQAMFWGRHLGIAGNASSGAELQGRLETARVLLLASGTFGACVADLLERTGIGTLEVIDSASAQLPGDAADDVDLVVCAVNGTSGEVAATANRIC